MAKKTAIARNGAKTAVGAVVIIIACSSGRSSEEGPTISLSSDPPPATDFVNEAQAATLDASVQDEAGIEEEACEAPLPLNLSHISFRLPRVPDVQVLRATRERYPDRLVRVTQEAEATIVTILVEPEQNATFRVAQMRVTAVDEDGAPTEYEQVGEEASASFRSSVLLGTNELEFGTSHVEYEFGDGARHVLQTGENHLEGPVSTEFIGGEMRPVMEGEFIAPCDMTCRVEFSGCDQVFSLIEGQAQCRTEPFDVLLRAGQKLGIYPVTGPGVEAVQITLSSSPSGEE